MKTYAEAYEEPAVDLLGSDGIRVAQWRFCTHLSRFATSHATGYYPRDTARRLRAATEAPRTAGSPFTTISGGHTGFSRGGI